MGLRLARLSRAEDSRTVDPRGEAKSVSAETTFEEDIADPAPAPGDAPGAVGEGVAAAQASRGWPGGP